jgi:hypothetical protein
MIALGSNNVVAQTRDGIDIRIIQPQTGVDDCARWRGTSSNDGLNLGKIQSIHCNDVRLCAILPLASALPWGILEDKMERLQRRST